MQYNHIDMWEDRSIREIDTVRMNRLIYILYLTELINLCLTLSNNVIDEAVKGLAFFQDTILSAFSL